MPSLRIALAQINTIVGDLAGTARKLAAQMARRVGADLVFNPERDLFNEVARP